MTMDYKYIEQLLDRYFECETSLAEEQILRAFFAQENVPVRLLEYRSLFTETVEAVKEEQLTDNFDKKILAMIGEEEKKEPVHVKARIISMQRRLTPLYKAAACVAVVLALGQAAQMPYNEAEREQDNIANYMQKPDIQKDQNAVAKSDSVVNKNDKLTN